eukprot:1367550-Pyramimonas_sp.AAC.1
MVSQHQLPQKRAFALSRILEKTIGCSTCPWIYAKGVSGAACRHHSKALARVLGGTIRVKQYGPISRVGNASMSISFQNLHHHRGEDAVIVVGMISIGAVTGRAAVAVSIVTGIVTIII